MQRLSSQNSKVFPNVLFIGFKSMTHFLVVSVSMGIDLELRGKQNVFNSHLSTYFNKVHGIVVLGHSLGVCKNIGFDFIHRFTFLEPSPNLFF